MIGRWLRVARPNDWTGGLARFVMAVLLIGLLILVPLVAPPASWIALAGGLAGGRPWVVRVVVLGVAGLGVGLLHTFVVAYLPRATVLTRRMVRFHDGISRRTVPIAELKALHVEQRPAPRGEVFVLEHRDGRNYDLCPTHWAGAPALHRALDRRVATVYRRRVRSRSVSTSAELHQMSR